VVGMAGYNTSCEVLGARTPAVLVPRASQRDEQKMRATRLAERGLVDTVDPGELAPDTLAAAATRALARGRRTGATGLSRDGDSAVGREAARVLPGPEPVPVPAKPVAKELRA